MTTAASPANTTRRNVMLSAWRIFRDYAATGKAIRFGKALKMAWASAKRLAKAADAFLARAARNGGRVSFGSPIYSPTSNGHAGTTYGRFNDRQAGRSISRVGR